MNKVITKIRSGIGGYLKDNILFLTFVFASVLNGFLLRAFTVKFNYSQIKPLMADFAVILLLAHIICVQKTKKAVCLPFDTDNNFLYTLYGELNLLYKL